MYNIESNKQFDRIEQEIYRKVFNYRSWERTCNLIEIDSYRGQSTLANDIFICVEERRKVKCNQNDEDNQFHQYDCKKAISTLKVN